MLGTPLPRERCPRAAPRAGDNAWSPLPQYRRETPAPLTGFPGGSEANVISWSTASVTAPHAARPSSPAAPPSHMGMHVHAAHDSPLLRSAHGVHGRTTGRITVSFHIPVNDMAAITPHALGKAATDVGRARTAQAHRGIVGTAQPANPFRAPCVVRSHHESTTRRRCQRP
jgi:hypothetical protein